MKKTNCLICDKETKFGGETCSRECSGILKKIRNREFRKCVFCGNKFEIKKNLKNKLCSDICRKKWAQIPENKERRIKKSHKTIKNNNNGNWYVQTKEFKIKSKSTKKGRYGDENYNNQSKSKSTKKDRHGDENYNNQSKSKSTKKDRYGDENYNNRDKAKETSKKLYGVEHAMKLKEFQYKSQKTNFKNTGFKFPLQNDKSKKSKIITNLEKYGFEYATQSEEVKNKVRDWYFNKFDLTNIHKQMDISGIKFLEEYEGIRCKEDRNKYRVYKFECNNCKNHFLGTFSNHIVPVCRKCYPMYKNNKIHMEIYDFLEDNKIKFYDNVKHIIKPYELDFYFEDYNLAIELNGNYYHSEIGGGKNREYHLRKSMMCKDKNIKLIHIFEDEWMFKKDIVKSMLLNSLKKITEKIHARKCKIKYVDKDDAFMFLNDNHIQGNVNFNKSIGLFYNEELISIMTFVNKKNNILELNRFCSKKNTIVNGAFSRLFKFFIKNKDIKIIKTFADCRWSGLNENNSVYSKNGFVFKEFIKPRFFYFKKGNYLRRYHRFTFNKKRLIKLSNGKYEDWMKEWDLAKSLKMDRIWDCGKLSYEFVNNF